jgi:RNA exonuclease 4
MDPQPQHCFKEVQQRVSELLKGRILVGHALKHDMRVLFLDHPKRMLRDTSGYKPFR